MNSRKSIQRPTIDTMMNVLTVGGMAIACSVFVMQGIQTIPA